MKTMLFTVLVVVKDGQAVAGRWSMKVRGKHIADARSKAVAACAECAPEWGTVEIAAVVLA